MTRPDRDSLLAVYLRDHDAIAAAEVALFRRVASGGGDPDAIRTAAGLVPQVERDRAALRAMMAAVGAAPSRVKPVLAVAAERAGRLKPNGRLVSRTPLTDVVELEGLRLAVEVKVGRWRLLRLVAEGDDRLDTAELDRLSIRARDQADVLGRLCLRVAGRALGPDKAVR